MAAALTYMEFQQRVMQSGVGGNRAIVALGIGRMLPWDKWRGTISMGGLRRWCAGLSDRTILRHVRWLLEHTEWLAIPQDWWRRGRFWVAVRTEALLATKPRPQPWERDEPEFVDVDQADDLELEPDEQLGWQAEPHDDELQLEDGLEVIAIAGDDELDDEPMVIDEQLEEESHAAGGDFSAGPSDDHVAEPRGHDAPPCPYEVTPGERCRLRSGHHGLCEPPHRPPTATATATATARTATATATATATGSSSGMQKLQDALKILGRRRV